MGKNDAKNAANLRFLSSLKVALVYDWIHTFGGAERILEVLHKLFPCAPLFTSVYDKNETLWTKTYQIIPSFLQHFPFARTNHELYPFLTPLSFEYFDLNKFDLVISVTSADAKGVLTLPKTLHLAYILTPTRYLWSHQETYLPSKITRILIKPILGYLQSWDKIAASRPDHLLTISKTAQNRIKKYYHRNSVVIYPPVSITNYQTLPAGRQGPKANLSAEALAKAEGQYYLCVSRLVPYKKVAVLIEAFNTLGKKLIIVGTGRQESHLTKIKGPNITIISNLKDKTLFRYYNNCRGVIIPAEEDFGLVSLEAQASGTPVIAYGKGGALETVIPGKTGIFFAKQNKRSIIEALQKFENTSFKSADCVKNASKYSQEKFINNFLTYTAHRVKVYRKGLALNY